MRNALLIIILSTNNRHMNFFQSFRNHRQNAINFFLPPRLKTRTRSLFFAHVMLLLMLVFCSLALVFAYFEPQRFTELLTRCSTVVYILLYRSILILLFIRPTLIWLFIKWLSWEGQHTPTEKPRTSLLENQYLLSEDENLAELRRKFLNGFATLPGPEQIQRQIIVITLRICVGLLCLLITPFRFKANRSFDEQIFVFAFIAVRLALPFLYYSLVHGVFYALPKVFTLVLPAVTLCAGVAVIISSHPVKSLLCLILIFFNTVVLYLAAQAEFLALVFLIVYVGAIAILFLFVIRLLNIKELSAVHYKKQTRAEVLLAHLAGLTVSVAVPLTLSALSQLALNKRFVTQVAAVLSRTEFRKYVSWNFRDIKRFSALLYTYYGVLFIIVAFLLLTARLGAIILATSTVHRSSCTR